MKVLVLDHEVLVLNIWSWSWWKSLAVFQDFCVILDGSEQGTPRHFARDNKSIAIRKTLFERTFCTPCTSASVERVFNNGGYLIGHTDASKAQCIDCGKLFSLGSNKPGKQTVHGLKCHLEKKPQRYLYTVHEESGIPSTRTTCKKAKLDEILAAHCRADLVTECMKKKKTLILSGDFCFRFWPKMNVHFRFGHKWNFIFVGIFVYGRKWKMLFGRPLVYITKRSWSWDAKSWSWKNFKVLVLKLRSWSWSLSWKKFWLHHCKYHNKNITVQDSKWTTPEFW